jgi:hypothetical protein
MIIAFSLVGASLLGVCRAADDEHKVPSVPVVPGANVAKVGSRCQVELNPVTHGRNVTVTHYAGVISRINADGLGLTVSEERREVVKNSTWSRLPLLSRLTRNVGIRRPSGNDQKEIWLPTETIYSVKQINGK